MFKGEPMNLKKSDKIVAIVGVIILIAAGIFLVYFYESEDEVDNNDDKKILHAIRDLRNKLVHNIRFEPDFGQLQKFVKDCFNEDIDTAEKQRCSKPEETERIFRNQITKAYSIISNKYKKQIDKNISAYLKSTT